VEDNIRMKHNEWPELSPNPGWDARRYEQQYSFVWSLAAGLVEILDPQPGERILDVGCGTGQLTEIIARSGADVTGMDRDETMIAQAREHFPSIRFVVADAAQFTLASLQASAPFDAIFSNAALHWMKPPERAAASMAQALRRGGRLVAEFGGQDNIAAISVALTQALEEHGHRDWRERYPWYFPGIGEYASLLEAQGFRVTSAAHFDRPTELKGENGMENWVQMFGTVFLQVASEKERHSIIRRVEELTRPVLYRNGRWWADYRRLRITAVRP
jgi:trans-aconitate 2-methyltransferase